MVEEKIFDLLEAKFAEPDFTDCFLIELHVHSGKKVEIIVDADEGVTFSQCTQISRYVESFLDDSLLLGDDYTLEVSSPGVGRPLKLWRQYPRQVGRQLEITLTDDSLHSGLLVSVGETSLVLEETIKRKEGKRNITEKVQRDIPADHIKKAIVKVSFKE